MKLEALAGHVKRQRAELFALQLLMDGLLLALPREARAAVQQQFALQTERWVAEALHTAKADETVHDVQQAADRLQKRVAAVLHR